MGIPWGTIVNALSVIVGGALGLVFKKRLENLPVRFEKIVFQAIGLFTLLMGVMMVIKAIEPLSIVLSLIIGGLLGEWLMIEERLEHLGERFKTALKSKDSRFAEGMVTAFLIFCVGSLTIMGAIDEGLRGDPSLLFVKSVLDGTVAISLAATLGIGVLFSFIPLLIFQLAVTVIAVLFRDLFSPQIIDQLTATGGVLVLGLGFNLLDIKKIRVGNLLPAIILVVLFTLLWLKFFANV
jgi:hypothetical protein